MMCFLQVVIVGRIAKARAYEVDLALEHLQYTCPGDLLLFDRGYPSYLLLATLIKLPKRHFVIRCSKKSEAQAQTLFKQDVVTSRMTTLKPPSSSKNKIKKLGLPEQITGSEVSVRLSTGELEVLVTSLADEKLYPTLMFKEIYYLRWGVECFYSVIKERLNLENFSGKTALSVKQDFHATLFLTSLESILTQFADEELAKKSANNKLRLPLEQYGVI
jgi:hypothetical protein